MNIKNNNDDENYGADESDGYNCDKNDNNEYDEMISENANINGFEENYETAENDLTGQTGDMVGIGKDYDYDCNVLFWLSIDLQQDHQFEN